jgi:hypothetical protein
VQRDAESLELFSAANPLQKPPPEPVQGCHHYGDPPSLRTRSPDFGQERLILWPIITTTRENVLILIADDPTLRGGIAPALGQLRVETDALSSLIVAADASVYESRRHA